MIRGIVFDKDGTLFDFEATWGAWSHGLILEEADGDAIRAEELGAALGYDMARRRFQPGSVVIAQTTRIVAETILPFTRDRDLTALIARLDARSTSLPQTPVTDLPVLMAALRARGISLGLATNDTEAPARAHLAQAGIAGQFDFIAGFDSGWGGKPAPGQLLAFADQAGLPPDACAMVGDSLHDLTAAHAAGMRAVAVLTGLATAEDLRDHADVVLPSVAALPGWLDADANPAG